MNVSKLNTSECRSLIFVKYLYNFGVSQSTKTGLIKSSCLLSFHDAVENFMILACNKENVGLSRNSTFDKYFTEYENKTKKSISEKNEMNFLNNARISLKHYGNFPSDETVSKVKIDVSEFFEKNTPSIFNVSFEGISMIDLVNHEKVQDLLHESIKEKNKKLFAQAIRKCAEAMHVLLREYRKNISKDWDRNIFEFGNKITVEDAILRNDDKRNKGRDFAIAYGRMSDAVTIIGFGIDYRKYAKFMMIAPSVSITTAERVHYGSNKNLSGITVEEFQFCHDFVIDTAIRLQEFEIDPDALTTTRTSKKIKEWEEEARRAMAEQEKATE